MKSYLAGLLLVTLVFLYAAPAPAPASAAGVTAVRMEVSSSELTIGERFEVTIQASNAMNLAGLSFALHYDPSAIRLEQADGVDLITIAQDFSLIAGQTVDKENGVLVYPLLYSKPMSQSPSAVPVMTITFTALKEGHAEIALEDIAVSNYVSKSIEQNSEDSAQVHTTAKLYRPPESVTFDIRAAFSFAKQGGEGLFDLTGDGIVDKEDVVFILEQIEPVMLSTAP